MVYYLNINVYYPFRNPILFLFCSRYIPINPMFLFKSHTIESRHGQHRKKMGKDLKPVPMEAERSFSAQQFVVGGVPNASILISLKNMFRIMQHYIYKHQYKIPSCSPKSKKTHFHFPATSITSGIWSFQITIFPYLSDMTRGRGLSQLGHVPIIHHVNNLAIHALARQLLDSSSNATTAAVTATAVTGAKEAVATVATTA